jgi:hypothetical protein
MHCVVAYGASINVTHLAKMKNPHVCRSPRDGQPKADEWFQVTSDRIGQIAHLVKGMSV